MTRPAVWIVCLMLPWLGLTGCAQVDPLTRDGMWQPVSANTTNLRAMVAVPGDLVMGRAARTSDGNQAAKAMERFRTDRMYPLPDSGISKVGAGSSSGAPPAAAPTTGPQ